MSEANDIAVLVMAVERLAEAQVKTNDKVDKLIESMGKQEVILEKLANIEKNHTEALKRIYNTIDTHVAERKELVANIQKKLDIFETYMLREGCPAHKSFLIGYSLNKERLDKTTAGLETRIEEIEQTPNRVLKTVINGTLAVFGAGIGTWLLFKFGLGDTK